MALFTWKLAYLTGISVIDADHARLFNLAKSLHSALAQGSGGAEIEERLASLVEHTREHFAREEELMAGEAYPALALHRAEHDELARKAQRIRRDVAARDGKLAPESLRSLKSWLATHIETTDRQFAEWLIRSGRNRTYRDSEVRPI